MLDLTRLVAGLNSGHQDFVIFPITARAALAGLNPYEPLPELARSFSSAPLDRLPHPTPYPPPALFLGLPFAFLSDAQSLAIWLLIGVACLAIGLLLIYKDAGSSKAVGITLLLFVVWHPVFLDLGYGQVMIPILLVTVLLWRALRAGNDIAGGLFLGVLLAFKLFAWPIALLLIIRKRWRAVSVAAGIMLIGHLAFALWCEAGPIVQYYSSVGREVAAAYHYDFANFSPLTVGSRLFEGREGAGLKVYPLLYAPRLAGPVSLLAIGLLFIWGMFTALRARAFDSAFAVLVCLSLLLNPVAWRHYLVLLAIPFAVIAARAAAAPLSKHRALILGAMVFFALSMGHVYQIIAAVFARSTPEGLEMPAIAGLLGLLPLLFVLSVMRIVKQP